MALLDRAIVRVLPAVPRRVVRRLSDPYIAGPGLADALAAVRALNEAGKKATLAVLGDTLDDVGELAGLFPYGEKWYEHSLRRPQENPKVAGYVARDVLRHLRAPLAMKTWPPGRAGRHDAASSVAPVASGYERALRPCLARAQRTPATRRHRKMGSRP